MLTLRETLVRLTVYELQSLIDMLTGVQRVGRKAELIDRIQAQMQADGLRNQWGSLNDMQQAAVAEALHGDGRFYPVRFQAKYGKSVGTAERSDRYSQRLTSLALFLYQDDVGHFLPVDLRDALRTFVTEPEPVRLITTEILPDSIRDQPVEIRITEREALLDLPVMLRLMEQGKVRVSDKTRLPGKAALALLSEQLAGGDFYDDANVGYQEIGAIKAFAWPMLLQAGDLTQMEKGKLALSKAGIRALSKAPAEVLKGLWKKWLGNRLLDEFSRVDLVKGQKSKGRVMTAPGRRRGVISKALACCPVGEWVEVDELGRYMRAADLDFEVTHDPWKLYIFDPQYGSLGYSGFHDWDILQLRYLLAFLFEYAAPLGMIDIAYVDPDGNRDNFGDLWGTDELNFLSRYDGLSHIRLTELGAWCLGLRDQYVPHRLPSTLKLDVLPSLQFRVTGGQPSAQETLLLDGWAMRVADGCWRLDRVKTLSAAGKGHDIGVLESLLLQASDQPLPEPVEAFFKHVRQHATALRTAATALLVECQSPEIARQIASHRETTKLCLPAGERHLAVRVEHEGKFREAVHVLGFGWAV
jgi:hypothetical protein